MKIQRHTSSCLLARRRARRPFEVATMSSSVRISFEGLSRSTATVRHDGRIRRRLNADDSESICVSPNGAEGKCPAIEWVVFTPNATSPRYHITTRSRQQNHYLQVAVPAPNSMEERSSTKTRFISARSHTMLPPAPVRAYGRHHDLSLTQYLSRTAPPPAMAGFGSRYRARSEKGNVLHFACLRRLRHPTNTSACAPVPCHLATLRLVDSAT